MHSSPTNVTHSEQPDLTNDSSPDFLMSLATGLIPSVVGFMIATRTSLPPLDVVFFGLAILMCGIKFSDEFRNRRPLRCAAWALWAFLPTVLLYFLYVQPLVQR